MNNEHDAPEVEEGYTPWTNNVPLLKGRIQELEYQLFRAQEEIKSQANLLEWVRAHMEKLPEALFQSDERISIADAQVVVETMLAYMERSKAEKEELEELRASEENRKGVPVEKVNHKKLAGEIGFAESRLSELIEELRGEELIKTPKGRRITQQEAKIVREEANNRGRPERRKNPTRLQNAPEFWRM